MCFWIFAESTGLEPVTFPTEAETLFLS